MFNVNRSINMLLTYVAFLPNMLTSKMGTILANYHITAHILHSSYRNTNANIRT